MILMYFYSTYKFSPVGFEIGSISLPIEKNGKYIELKKSQDIFVRKCFENGNIMKIYGKNPVNGHYLFMIKQLRCEYINENNMPSYKKSNFLFEFDNINEYTCFVINYEKAKLEDAMNNFIIPDSFAETFAFKIHMENLNKYISSAISSTTKSNIKHVEIKDLYFEITDNETKVEQELSSYLGVTVKKVDKLRLSTKQNFLKATLREIIRVVKKHLAIPIIVMIIIGGIALIAMLIWTIVSRIRLLVVL